MTRVTLHHSAQLALLLNFLVWCIYLIYVSNNTSEEVFKAELNISIAWSPENEVPLCKGNLLDEAKYRYPKEMIGSHFDSSQYLMAKSGPCRLLNYTAERIVQCLDTIRYQHSSDIQLRFLFMGDSRTRQQFLNFVRVIPDYDKTLKPSHIPLLFQGDMTVKSEILGLQFSFRWQPFLDDDIKKLAIQWIDSIPSQRPSLVLLSMGLWHMFHVKHRDYRCFKKKLMGLAPVLSQLSNVTRVIWLNQYPTIEFFGTNNSTNTYIHSEKINHYNKAVRRILLEKNEGSNIQIWDSGNQLAEEYVRSCNIFQRYDETKSGSGLLKLRYYSCAYRNCPDFIHTGYSALSHITQHLYNDICSMNQI